MTSPTTTRLPLQVGTSAINNLCRAGATLVPGLVMTLGAIPLFLTGSVVSGLICVVFGVQLALLGFFSARRVLGARASDVLLSAEGLRFEGGPRDGVSIGWNQLDASRCTIEEEEVPRRTFTKIFGDVLFWIMSMFSGGELEGAPPDFVPICRLRLGVDGAEPEVYAETDTPQEGESLKALHSTIQARLSPATAPSPPSKQKVLTCQTCSAPLIPEDREEVTCSHCQAQNPVPKKLRKRVQAAQRLEQDQPASLALVSKLLKQPGAERANVILALMAVLMLLAWPAAVIVAGFVLGLGMADAGFEIGFLVVNGIIFALAVFFFLRFGIVNRGALHMLTLGFAARPPAGEQKGYTCRNCGGPLVAGAQQVITSCVYCDADNVLGLDLRPQARQAKKQKQSLDQSLQLRSRRRRRWLVAALVAVGGIVISLGLGSAMVGEVLVANAKASDCEEGDLTACARVGEKYAWGKGVEEDHKKAAWALTKACEGGDARSCGILGGLYEDDDWALPKNTALYQKWLKKACDGGYKQSCEELKQKR